MTFTRCVAHVGLGLALTTLAASASAQSFDGIPDWSGVYRPVQGPVPTAPRTAQNTPLWAQYVGNLAAGQRDRLVLTRGSTTMEEDVRVVTYSGVYFHAHPDVVETQTIVPNVGYQIWHDFFGCAGPNYVVPVTGRQEIRIDPRTLRASSTNTFGGDVNAPSEVIHGSRLDFSLARETDPRREHDTFITWRWSNPQGTTNAGPCRPFEHMRQQDGLSIFMKKTGAAPFDFETVIRGQLEAATASISIDRAIVNLYAHDDPLPSGSQNPIDDIVNLRDRLRLVARVSIDAQARFQIPGVKLFRRIGSADNGAYVPAYYTLAITGAEADAAQVEGPLGFRPVVARNLLATPDQGTYPVYRLQPDLLFTIKRGLIRRLQALAPNNYGPAEADMLLYINTIEAQPTAAQREGVQRSVWAERVLLEGAETAQALLKPFNEMFADIMADLITDQLFSQHAELQKGQKEKSRIDAADASLSPAQRARFKLGNAQARRADEAYRKRLDMVQHSKIGAGLKATLSLAMHGMKAAAKRSTSNPQDLAAMNATLDRLKFVLDALLDTMIAQSNWSAGKGAVKLLLKSILQTGMQLLFDNRITVQPGQTPLNLDVQAVPSFAKQTRQAALDSVALAQGWSTADADAYDRDRAGAVAILNNIASHGTSRLQIYGYAKAVSDSANLADTVFGLAGPLAPQFEAASRGAKATEALALIANLLQLAQAVFSWLPGEVERGVYRAYGMAPPMRLAFGDAPNGDPLDPSLATELEAARLALVDALDAVRTQVATAELGPAVDSALEGGELDLAWRRLAAALAANTDQALASDYGSVQPGPPRLHVHALDASQRARVAQLELLDALMQALVDVTEERYTDEDPGWSRALGQIEHRLARAQTAAERAAMAHTALTDEMTRLGVDVLPALHVANLEVTSDLTGDAFVSQLPETFTVRAHVRNLGQRVIRDAALALAVIGPAGFEVTSSTVSALSTLAANDGAAGGADEAEVSWTLQARGPATAAARQVVVSVSEGGEDPSGFISQGARRFVPISPALLDPDGDGMPVDWELANQLDPATDDGDLDPDNDGLSNRRERILDTDPQVGDSDGDGLLDGEEVTLGADGYRTDPRRADSDGDGADDDVDGAPLDPGTTAPTPAPDEPTLAVSATELTLTAEQRFGLVDVTGTATAALYWTARSADPSVVTTSVRAPRTVAGPGELEIRIADGVDLSRLGSTTVPVAVAEIAGGDPDLQIVMVNVVSEAAPPVDAGVEDGGTDGGGTDGGVTPDGGATRDGGVTAPRDGGVSSRPDAGPMGGGGDDEGGGCRCGPSPSPATSSAAAAWLVGLLAVWTRRRRS